MNFTFPIKGINRTFARGSQPEGTAYDMLNVLPFDRSGRLRGGKRTGTAKLWASALGTGTQPIQLLDQTTIALDPASVTTDQQLVNETFTYSDGNLETVAGTSVWKTYFSAVEDATAFAVASGQLKGTATANMFAVYQPTLTLGTAYVIKLDISAVSLGTSAQANIGARLTTTPSGTGIWLNTSWTTGGTLTLALGTTNGSSGLATYSTAAGFLTAGVAHTVELHINGNDIKGYLDGIQRLSVTSSSGAGQSVIQLFTGNVNPRMDNFLVFTGKNLATYRQTNIVAVCGGNVYEGDLNTQATVATSGTGALSSTANVQGCSAEGKYYLVDGFTIAELDIATKTMVTYAATAGTAPTKCTLACMYRDRLVLAAPRDNPQNFFFSRVGTQTDWDYSQTDPAAAFAGNASISGRIGEPIAALIPFSDDQLAIAGDHNLWVVRGDPADGGSIDLVSDAIGILGPRAWCKSPDGTVYMVGTGGLFKWSVGSNPVLLSHLTYNEFFKNINRGTQYVLLTWDRDRQGLVVYVTPINTGTATHLWGDARTGLTPEEQGGFFPLQFPNSHGPISVLVYDGDGPTDRVTLLGGRDGYVRALNDTRTHDDGSTINGYVIWPFLLGDEKNDGIAGNVIVTLGDPPSGYAVTDMSLTVKLRAGLTVYDVTDGRDTAKIHLLGRTFADVQGYTTPLTGKARGKWASIELSDNSDSNIFSFESVSVDVEPAGKTRR